MTVLIAHIRARTPRGKLAAAMLCGRSWTLLTTDDEHDFGAPWRLCAQCEKKAANRMVAR